MYEFYKKFINRLTLDLADSMIKENRKIFKISVGLIASGQIGPTRSWPAFF
jgi:hypothetical protein